MKIRTQRTAGPSDPSDDSLESSTVKWSQERRLQFIDFRLQWEGRINRKDVTEFFKISIPQASADLTLYQHLMPDNMRYDTSTRMYVADPEFMPRSDTSGARQYLSQLLSLHRGILTGDQTFLSFAPPMESVPLPARSLDAKTLLPLIQAIAERGKLKVKYQSISRDEAPARFISPHAFGYDGIRWHVRAYCETRRGFKDFVLGRILSAEQPEATDIKSTDDLDWQQYVDLVLKPDPSLSPAQRRGIERDYTMKNGTSTVTCRKAMLFYTLRTLNFEIDGLPRGGEKQLVIANLAEIKSLLPSFGQA
ncbi:MAG: WYL domain-containing protein [Rhizobacter sp.]